MRKKVFVFDLDFTLWDAGGTWCDATNPPYSWQGDRLTDRSNRWIRLYPEVEDILKQLQDKGKYIVAASRTYRPDWAQDLLDLFDIDRFFHLKEIYPADKTKHFRNIQRHFDLPYSEMVFFDDEYRNIADVKNLGVEAVFVDSGINKRLVEAFF
ncbi:magnesium-dependent phosphatase-1 [Maribellus sediminis]|uniref:magnesium-dependent phosphatase-1 n=1 Tax=Maribellus sediminis TaxID=2696285 RepID=UPI0014309627|nr:magnesium-dependent phosphatase-1 [Maribellus sediminis]